MSKTKSNSRIIDLDELYYIETNSGSTNLHFRGLHDKTKLCGKGRPVVIKSKNVWYSHNLYRALATYIAEVALDNSESLPDIVKYATEAYDTVMSMEEKIKDTFRTEVLVSRIG